MQIDFYPQKFAQIDDWTSLGAAIGVKTNIMAWALKNRDEFQKKIRLGERVVYRSEKSLRYVQSRILPFLEEIFEGLPDTKSAIAYRKGQAPETVIKETEHAKRLIHFDIVHYYDNITLKLIEESLMRCGLPELGARLIGRYNCVKANGRTTLQQGSPSSPVISNIVGHCMIDLPTKKWLSETFPEVSCTYLRYCDNVALFVHSDSPEYFSEAYKGFLKRHLKKVGFRMHKWSSVSDKNRVKNQYFLGMVLNAEAKKERPYLSPILAALFNWCRFGLHRASDMFLEYNGMKREKMSLPGPELIGKQFKQVMLGKINYIARINEKQGLMVKKLYAAANYLDEVLKDGVRASGLVDEIKKYRNQNESVDDYLYKIKNFTL